jgi:hypothetical protein
MKRSISLSLVVGTICLPLLTACGGGGGGSSLPAECKTNSPLQITSPGIDELNGEFTPTDTVIYQGKMVPGAELFGKTPEELKALEAESIGTAYRAIVADFPIKDAQIIGGFNSGVYLPEEGGTYFYLSLFPNESGTWTAGDVLSATSPDPYLTEVGSSLGAHISMSLQTQYVESYFLTVSTDYEGSVTVLAADDKNLCLSIDYSAPVFGSNGADIFNLSGVISGKVEDFIDGDLAG